MKNKLRHWYESFLINRLQSHLAKNNYHHIKLIITSEEARVAFNIKPKN